MGEEKESDKMLGRFLEQVKENATAWADITDGRKLSRQRGQFNEVYDSISKLMAEHVHGKGLVYYEAGLGSWGGEREQGAIELIKKHHSQFKKFFLHDKSVFPIQKAANSIKKLPEKIRKKIVLEKLSVMRATPAQRADVVVSSHMALFHKQGHRVIKTMVGVAKPNAFIFMDNGTAEYAKGFPELRLVAKEKHATLFKKIK